MPVVINMQNELVGGSMVNETFDDTVSALNQYASRGDSFATFQKVDGYKRAFYVPNILTIDEVSDDEVPLA
jgi:hypothetical protein